MSPFTAKVIISRFAMFKVTERGIKVSHSETPVKQCQSFMDRFFERHANHHTELDDLLMSLSTETGIPRVEMAIVSYRRPKSPPLPEGAVS